MGDPILLRETPPQPSLDEVAAAYPRQIGMHYLYRAYASGMVPVSLADLLAAFRRYAAYIRTQDGQFVMSIRRYVEDRCWNDVYELPKQPCDEMPQYDRREALRASAAKGNRFSADILKRDYNE